MIKVKRIYEAKQKDDGFRILVDRLWPRGLSKSKANIDLWLKDIAPSDSLRKWFSHDPKKWEAFRKKYADELARKTDLVNQIKKIESDKGVVTLLFSSKEEDFNDAVALNKILLAMQ